MIRLVIVDDHQLVREGLEALLASAPDIAVVGTAGGGVEGVDLVEHLRPDDVLLDLSMPDLDGLGVLVQLNERRIQARAIVLTTFDDDLALLKATGLGAAGFLLKDLSRAELESAIRSVHGGERVFRPTVGGAVRAAFRVRRPDMDRSRPIEPLTPRERDVLRLMAGGLSNKEIAAALDLSEGTVKNHVSVVLAKFGVTDRTRAVLKALERQVL